MKKLLLLFLWIILLVNTSGATINIPNANGTELFVYEQAIPNDTVYVLNPTDSVQLFSIDNYVGVRSYPQNTSFNFSSSSYNINITTNYTQHEGAIYDHILAHSHVYENGIDVGNFSTDVKEYHIRYLYSDFDSLIFEIGFYGKKATFTTKKQVLSTPVWYNIANSSFYIINIIIPTVIDNDKLHYENLRVRYLESGYAIVSNNIAELVDSLNPILRLIYYLLNSAIYIFNKLEFWTGGLVGISDIDAINYKITILQPLELISSMIDLALRIVSFIFTMGLLLVFGLITLIIFIYSFITSNNILDTFSRFGELMKSFISNVIITPAIWIYDNFLKILSLIRGGG